MTDLNTQILIEIRDQLRAHAGRLDRLETSNREMQLRIATEVVEVAKSVRELRDAVLEDRDLRAKVEDHESRLRRLEG